MPLATADIADADLTSIIALAVARVNADINIRIDVTPERIEYIDYEKQNTKNGTNTTFYTKFWPIGDFNNDGQLTTADLEVFKISSAGTRTDLTVSTLNDWKIGKFTLSTAPNSSDTLYMRYSIAPLDESTPHPLIKQATMYLSAAMAQSKVGSDAFNSIALGRLRVGKAQYNNDIYISKYFELIQQIGELVRREKGKSLLEAVKNEPVQ